MRQLISKVHEGTFHRKKEKVAQIKAWLKMVMTVIEKNQ